jgi:monovalent cation:H+ antiporter-2, CPA2 family
MRISIGWFCPPTGSVLRSWGGMRAMDTPLFQDILLIFTLAIVVVYFCQRLNIPSVVGLLLTGVAAGPNGFGLVNEVHTVETMAELGVILLLFTIGIEFSLGKLMEMRKVVLLGGALQVSFTVAAASLAMAKLGFAGGEAIFIGCLVSLSSTAIVLNILQSRAEIDAPYGRSTLGILIFQDIVIIPMVLFAPLLADHSVGLEQSPWLVLGKVALIMGLLYVSARWAAPWFLYKIARQRSRELFLLSIVTMCMAVAWFTSSLGLSVALGAFLAGLIISESDYSHQALGNVLPFKDVFTSLFFVSIGMLMDPGVVVKQPWLILLAVGAVLLGKAVLGSISALCLRMPLRTALLTGLALSQVGEFSFVLASYGLEIGIIDGGFNQLFMAVSGITMVLTPFIVTRSPQLVQAVVDRLPTRLDSGHQETEADTGNLSDHLVIIGFGVNGRNLARAAASSNIAYVVVEYNPDTVRREKRKGETIFYGDATQPQVLSHAHIESARVVVIAISDPAAAVRITDLARHANPQLSIIVRTRYVQEITPLYQVGANHVIPEEFETSVEIFTLVLRKYLVSKVDIENIISEIRSDGYEMLRSLSRRSSSLMDIKLHHHDAEIANLRVIKGSSTDGRTLAEIDLRGRYGGSVLLIQRGVDTIVNPGSNDRLQDEDQVIVLARPEFLEMINALFSSEAAREIPGTPGPDSSRPN